MLIFLTGCVKENNSNVSNPKKEIYVSNYTFETRTFEVLVLDENLNLVKALKPKGGMYLYSDGTEGLIYSYGSDRTIAKINGTYSYWNFDNFFVQIELLQKLMQKIKK